MDNHNLNINIYDDQYLNYIDHHPTDRMFDTMNIKIKRDKKKQCCKRLAFIGGLLCMNSISFLLGSLFYSKYYIIINDDSSSSNN